MTELKLFETLKASYEDSTPSYNRFKEALDAQDWDATFYADGEHYFCKGEFTFTTPSLDPFKITRNWMPSAFFSDGGYLEFA